MMTNPAFPRTESVIDEILELSADAQIKRREAAPASVTFHHLTGAILAYGKVLRALTKATEDLTEEYLVIKPMQSAVAAGTPL
jgi:hypothetical protein